MTFTQLVEKMSPLCILSTTTTDGGGECAQSGACVANPPRLQILIPVNDSAAFVVAESMALNGSFTALFSGAGECAISQLQP